MKKKAVEKSNPESGSASWLCTFNDLMTNLMVFFLLLFSLGSIDLDKSSGMIDSLQSGLGVLEAGTRTGVSVVDQAASAELMENDQASMREIYSEIYQEESENVEDKVSGKESKEDDKITSPDKATIDNKATTDHKTGTENQTAMEKQTVTGNGLSSTSLDNLNFIDGVSATYTSKGVSILLDNHLLFNSGQAAINASGLQILDMVIQSLKKNAYAIRVEGHTDNIPIHTRQYASNWELSIDRAIHVVKYFIETGGISPQRLSAVGYADVKPLVDNLSEERRARNRRVEIILISGGKTANER